MSGIGEARSVEDSGLCEVMHGLHGRVVVLELMLEMLVKRMGELEGRLEELEDG